MQNGGKVTSSLAFLGDNASSTGNALVTGTDSLLQSSNVYVGWYGGGTLDIAGGGRVTAGGVAIIGTHNGSTGTANIAGADSLLSTNEINVGLNGTGILNIQTGGKVNNQTAGIGANGGVGTALVENSGSQWSTSGDLTIGTGGTGTLNIQDSGLVSVGGTTTLGSNGTVNDDGGRFEFGQTTLGEFASINRISGSLAGDIHFHGLTQLNSLSSFQNNTADISEVKLVNSGTLYGGAFLQNSLSNLANGELRTLQNEWTRFSGIGNQNAGVINNLGGIVELENDLQNLNGGEINNFDGPLIAGQLTNDSGAMISGRGQFIADSWNNSGIIALSGGYADFHGDLDNQSTGQIAIGGGSIATFYDDVTMDAANMNIDVSEGSAAVFFGSFNGGNDGLGSVHAFGDLRPGNSPGVVSFGGDLELGQNTSTQIELAGRAAGEFDQLNVNGDLLLNGQLDVSLIDNHSLKFNESYLIADVDGDRFGEFAGLTEGDLVGQFGDHALFITYKAGDGNDVALFTAVPEPTALPLMALILSFGWRRRRARR